MKEIPLYFLHMELSAPVAPAIPAEIYLTGVRTPSQAFVVNPAGIARWAGWQMPFYAEHGIDAELLRTHGTQANEVCVRITPILESGAVYSFEPERDSQLLSEFFAGAAGDHRHVRVHSIEALVCDRLEQQGYPRGELAERYQRLVREAEVARGGHRGDAFEGLFMLELWRRTVTNSGRAELAVAPEPAQPG